MTPNALARVRAPYPPRFFALRQDLGRRKSIQLLPHPGPKIGARVASPRCKRRLENSTLHLVCSTAFFHGKMFGVRSSKQLVVCPRGLGEKGVIRVTLLLLSGH